MNIKRVWNGRFRGFPSASLMFFGVVLRRLSDRIATLLWKGNLNSFGRRSIIQRDVIVRWPGRVKVGNECSVGAGSSFTSEHADGFLEIGDRVIVNPRVHVDFTGGVKIERNAVLSEDVMIFSHSHGHDPRSVSRKTPLTIGEDVWIGACAVIAEGVGYIAPHTIVAAGAVVTREIRSPGLYGGVPARFIKNLEKD